MTSAPPPVTHGAIAADYRSENAAGAGPFAWFWLPVLENMREIGGLVDLNRDDSLPENSVVYVLGNALYRLEASTFARFRVRWLLDAPENFSGLTEFHLGRLEQVYSPLFPDELEKPAALAPQIFGAALAKTHFIIGATREDAADHERKGRQPRLPPAFHLHFHVPGEPANVVLWHGHFYRQKPTASDRASAATAMTSMGAPPGDWILTPPLDQFSKHRLDSFAFAGRIPIVCKTIREGIQASVRNAQRAATEVAPAGKTTLTDRGRIQRAADFPGGESFTCVELSRGDIGRELGLAFALPAEDPSPVRTEGDATSEISSFEAALRDWEAGRCSIVTPAENFVRTGAWRDPSQIHELRRRFLIESPQTPAAFLSNAFASLPLEELYVTRSERARSIAAFGTALLGEATAAPTDQVTEIMRLLAHALRGEAAAFETAFQRARSHLGRRYELVALSLAWTNQLSWSNDALPEPAEAGYDVPGELALCGVLALASSSRWSDAHALAGLVHATSPDFLLRPGSTGRFNKFVLWAGVCRIWGELEQSARALDWARSTDLTFDDQVFLVRRARPEKPADLAPLPRFASPWDIPQPNTDHA